MILYDPALNMNFQDYGIMLPIVPDRGKQILEFLAKNYYPGTRGSTMPYPGPVLSIADARSFFDDADRTITRKDLERVHSKEFIASLYDTQGNGLQAALFAAFELIDAQGKPNRYEPERAAKPLGNLFTTILCQLSGTYLACRLALAEGSGFCYFMGGGMHHARYNAGSGFCLLNDVVIAAAKILAENTAIKLIWIIDLDVHKGDGTAELIHFARQRGELHNVLSLSVHMAKGWPLDEESLACAKKDHAPLVASDVDIGIDSNEEKQYVPRLTEGIKKLEQLSAELQQGSGKPDLVLVVDGADPYEHDGLPSSNLLNLTLEQCLERDNYVYRYLMDRNIPSVWVQSGGYGDRAWEPPAYFLQGIR